MPTETKDSVLDGLRDQRKAKLDEWTSLVDARIAAREAFEARQNSDDDKPSEAEVTVFAEEEGSFEKESNKLNKEIKKLRSRIDEQELLAERKAEAAAAARASTVPAGDFVITNEDLTYERHKAIGDHGVSYYRDLAQCFAPGGISFQSTDRAQSFERLNRHAAEMDKIMPKRAKSREARAYAKFSEAESRDGRSLDFDPFHRGHVVSPFEHRFGRGGAGLEQRVEPNQAQGTGGYFIPPLWLEDQYIPQLVAHLVAAGLCRQMDLPLGTDSINIPAVNGGTAVGYQQANNSGVLTQDWTDTAVTANVKTIAGDSDVAIQLLEQSPHGLVDEVITMNLMQQYNKFLDQQVISGDGLNASQLNGGHLQGIYNGSGGSAWSNVETVTYTASAPAGYQFAQVLGAMASQVAKNRFATDDFKFVLHGRRWFWYSTAPDANDRPLGETSNGGPWNVQALIKDGFQAEGLVGVLPHVANVPAYIDMNIGTADTTGSGSGQDYAIAGLWSDAWLFQGALRTDVFREVLSSSLGVRFQIRNYAAFLLRYGQSFVVATGTGFAAPAGQNSSPSWTPASTTF